MDSETIEDVDRLDELMRGYIKEYKRVYGSSKKARDLETAAFMFLEQVNKLKNNVKNMSDITSKLI